MVKGGGYSHLFQPVLHHMLFLFMFPVLKLIMMTYLLGAMFFVTAIACTVKHVQHSQIHL
jgi:hypothetical protein